MNDLEMNGLETIDTIFNAIYQNIKAIYDRIDKIELSIKKLEVKE